MIKEFRDFLFMARMTKLAADAVTDEERRHQELLAAIRESRV